MDIKSAKVKKQSIIKNESPVNFSYSKHKNVNSNIGFDSEELKNSKTKDLLHLKNLVASYIKNTSQKMKNCEYLVLYKRILEEIKTRAKTEDIFVEKTSSEIKNELLGRKRSFENPVVQPQVFFEIPNFLNDKEIVNIKKVNENKHEDDIQSLKSSSSCSSSNSKIHIRNEKKDLKYIQSKLTFKL